MADIDWIIPRSGLRYNKGDVQVSTRYLKSQNKDVAFFTFYDGKEKEVSDDKIIIGISGQRLYFGETTERGHRPIKQSKRSVTIQATHIRLTEYCRKYKGFYFLKYDSQKKLHYIDINEVIK